MSFVIPKDVKRQHIAAICALIIAALFGYYKVFFGGHVFLHEDHFAISNYSYGNSLGNGWRPDKGFGISAFMGDGIWHPWSPLSLWERLMPSRTVAYNSSVILLGILASITQYFFLRRILPQAHYWTAVMLSPLVIFGSDQGGIHFLRVSISLLIAMPLFLVLLYDYFDRPSALHILTAGWIFAFVVAFGNTWSLTGLLSLGFFFLLSCYLYFRVPATAFIRKFILLYSAGGIICVLLSAWFLYSLFYESSVVGYMREKVMIGFNDIHFAVDLKGIVDFVLGAVFAEWLPVDHDIAGIGYKPFLLSYNVNAVFPLVFLFFLFRRSKCFWEYSLKILLSIFLIHNLLQRGNVLGYGDLYAFLSNKTSKLFTMYDFIYPLEVGLIAIFISGLTAEGSVIAHRWGRSLQRTLAGILFCFYVVLLCVGLLAILSPDTLTRIAQWSIQEIFLRITQRFPYELLNTVAVYDIKRFAEIMHVHVLLYYLSSAVLVAVFLKDSWLKYAARLSKEKICLFLLVNALLMSWTVYPLSSKKPAWDEMPRAAFNPTDRFYYVSGSTSRQTLESFKEKYSQIEGGGHRQRQIGLLEPPGLNLAGLKSFETKRVGEFIYHIFNGDGSERLSNLRLYYGGPVVFNGLLDMAAVKYYYSDFKLKDLPPYVTPFFQAKQLYVYKNERAWPYFYLAQKLGLKIEGEHLTNVERGTAYLDKKDFFDLPSGAGKGSVNLKQFSYGKMTFDYASQSDEFFVVADAWHPLWKAKQGSRELKVVRANEVFKGIHLPAGTYEFSLFFDPSAYKIGVYISLISAVVFLLCFMIVIRRKIELSI